MDASVTGAAPRHDRPAADEYAPFFAGYVARVPETAIFDVLAAQPAELAARIATVATADESFAYAPGKWTLRQLFGHLVDGERVFGYRALCISRRDPTPLPGFDENAFVERAPSPQVALADHVREFALLREANRMMLLRLDADAFAARGTASGRPITVRALAWIMAGHVRHHLAVLDERYAHAFRAR